MKKNKQIKKLNLRIETETEKDIVIIFADPSTKDLEDLLGSDYILNLVCGIIWNKNQGGGTDWMDLWERMRRKWETSQNVDGSIFQDVFVPEKFKAEDIKEDIDLVAEVNSVNVDELNNDVKAHVVETDLTGNDDCNIINENVGDFDNGLCDTESDIVVETNKSETEVIQTHRFTCNECNQAFSNLHQLTLHNKEIHDGIKPFLCDCCEKRFIVKDDLTFHKNFHCEKTNQKMLLCDVCNAPFLKRLGLIKHNKEFHNGIKPFSCDVCEQRFIIKDDLDYHIKMYCKGYTQKRFIKNDDLALNRKMYCVKEKQETLICDVCNETFSGKLNLIQHKKETHKDIKQYSCDICGKKFAYSTSLREHKFVHTGLKPHTCDICGKSFSLRKNLKTHSRIHTGEKPYSCDECGKSFTGWNNLDAHKRTHSSKKSLICDICSKAFSQVINLERHVLTVHTDAGEKPFSCSICEKAFIFPHKLTIHMRTHTGEKPFSCDVCGKAYASKSMLVRHQLVHSDVKQFLCDLCNKSFRIKEHFVRHSKSGGHLKKIKENPPEASLVFDNFKT